MKSSDLRSQKLSELLAALARQRDDVQGFRKHELRGKLLRPTQIERWIKNREPAPGEVQRRVAVPVPAEKIGPPDAMGVLFETRIKGPIKAVRFPAIKVSQGELLPPDLLPYPTAGNRWLSKARVGEDGPLRKLLQLSRRLSRHYGWQEAQAVIFVLVDLTPMVPPIRFGLTLNFFGVTLNNPTPALSRIRIDVDPSMTPRELYAHYSRFRAKILSKRKPRAPGLKVMELAILQAERPDLDDRALLNAWNAKFPKWAYKDPKRHLSHFSQNVDRGFALLQGPSIKPQVLAEFGEW